MTRPLILLTNDDGILSPGLASAASALDSLGDLLIAAPHAQESGSGRGMPGYHEGRLIPTVVEHKGKTWQAFAAHASPAQAVQHAVIELAERKPDLVVSGINYGENIGVSITISGTVGAALEGAAQGIRSIAVSLQTPEKYHLSHDDSIDFSTAAWFTRLFAEKLLVTDMPSDVDVLKIDVPSNATTSTKWQITRLERLPYYTLIPPERRSLEDAGRLDYRTAAITPSGSDTDAAALLAGYVSVTPLSLDMTSRISRDDLKNLLAD